MTTTPFIIGICGASASGKTSILNAIRTKFKNTISILSQDDYYFDKHLQVKDDNGFENFDLPSAIDVEAFLGDITKLKNNVSVERKEYTFNNPNLKPQIKITPASGVIIVEGIFIFHYPELFSMLELSVFIDSKKELKFARRLIRDTQERGYSEEYIHYTHKQHVYPAYKKYIKPYRNEADLIITNNEKGFEKGLEVLMGFIAAKV